MDFFSHITETEHTLRVASRARSYYYHHDHCEHAVLFIHGFSACPATLKPLAKWLHQKGMNVYGVRVAGHGTNLQDFASSTWQDWEDSVHKAFEFLTAKYRYVSIVSSSMGALLAIRLASNHIVKNLICMGAFLKAKNPFFYLSKTLCFLQPYIRFSLGSITNGTIPIERAGFWYERLPIKSILELYKLQRLTISMIENISCPTMVLHAPSDPVSHPDSATFLYNGLKTKNKQLFWFGHEHVFILESDKVAYSPIFSFLNH